MSGRFQRADMRALLRGVFREAKREPLLTLNLLRQYWREIVGDEMAQKTHPARLEKGVLWITAPDASWAFELQFFKSELLGSVRAFLESEAVRDLRFQNGTPTDADESQSSASGAETPGAQTGPPRQVDSPSAKRSPAQHPGFLPASASAVPPALVRAPAISPALVRAPAISPALVRASEAITDPALREAFQRSLSRRGRNH